MSEDLFANIEEFTGVGNTQSSAKNAPTPKQPRRKASPAAQQAASKRRSKPSVDRYRSADAMPTRPAVPEVQTPVKQSRKKKKNNTMSAEAMMKAKQPKKTKAKSEGNIFQRLVSFFRAHTLTGMWYLFLDWVSRHVYVVFLVAVLFIAAGMMYSRYISAAGAFVFIVLGALLSKEDYDTAGYCCYGAALMDFMIPYLI